MSVWDMWSALWATMALAQLAALLASPLEPAPPLPQGLNDTVGRTTCERVNRRNLAVKAFGITARGARSGTLMTDDRFICRGVGCKSPQIASSGDNLVAISLAASRFQIAAGAIGTRSPELCSKMKVLSISSVDRG
ncbi:hypothetical protein EVAR_23801_1 [Eumeta japonica]|uniref:Uncharacterized protein n=1 Tax=Eumeta variegata TaxID=151549 RepID=A0A4C1VLQ0_EUMVA|nr:hypothetical protein EVAR_23801_1 [Eumeta japonica]